MGYRKLLLVAGIYSLVATSVATAAGKVGAEKPLNDELTSNLHCKPAQATQATQAARVAHAQQVVQDDWLIVGSVKVDDRVARQLVAASQQSIKRSMPQSMPQSRQAASTKHSATVASQPACTGLGAVVDPMPILPADMILNRAPVARTPSSDTVGSADIAGVPPSAVNDGGSKNISDNGCERYQLRPMVPLVSSKRHLHEQYGLHQWFDVVVSASELASCGETKQLTKNSSRYAGKNESNYDQSAEELRKDNPHLANLCLSIDPAQVESCQNYEEPHALTNNYPLTEPNDPRYPHAWTINYQNNGQGSQNQSNELADLDVLEAWQIQRGDPDVIVGFADDSFDYRNPDLMASVFVNSAEDIDGDGRHTAADNNGIDDDENGYIDDVHGWNGSLNHSNLDVPTTSTGIRNSNSHGSRVLPPAFAGVDNMVGVPGVAGKWGSHASVLGGGVLGENVLGAAGASSNASSSGAQVMLLSKAFNGAALVYAADNGATIYNISYSSSYHFENDFSRYFVEQARSPSGRIQGGMIFVSSGNAGVGMTNVAAQSKYAISVTGTNAQGRLGEYGYGVLAGPAENVPTFFYGQHHDGSVGNPSYVVSGTSVASPIVSAVAALVRSECPSLTPEGVLAALIKSTVNTAEADNFGRVYSGLVNAEQALAAVQACGDNPVSEVNSLPVLANPSQLHFSVDPAAGASDSSASGGSSGQMTAEVVLTNVTQQSQSATLSVDNNAFQLSQSSIQLAPNQQVRIPITYQYNSSDWLAQPQAELSVSINGQHAGLADQQTIYLNTHLPWLQETPDVIPAHTVSQNSVSINNQSEEPLPAKKCVWWDYDQDTDLDIACYHGDSSSGRTELVLQDNQMSVDPAQPFVHRQTIELGLVDVDLLVNDWDLDGQTDLVIAGRQQHNQQALQLNWLSGSDAAASHNAALQAIDMTVENSPSQYLRPQKILLGDIDGDHRIDLLLLLSQGFSRYSAEVLYQQYELSPSSANRSFQQRVLIQSANILPNTIALFDQNGDGDQDMAYTLKEHNTKYPVKWLEQIAPRAFTVRHIANSIEKQNAQPTITDLNNDGLLDIITGSSIEPGQTLFDYRKFRSKIWLSKSAGEIMSPFGLPPEHILRERYSLGAAWFAQQPLDLDRDGMQELLVFGHAAGGGEKLTQAGFRLMNYQNDQQPFMQGEQRTTGKVGHAQALLSAADINRDGTQHFVMSAVTASTDTNGTTGQTGQPDQTGQNGNVEMSLHYNLMSPSVHTQQSVSRNQPPTAPNDLQTVVNPDDSVTLSFFPNGDDFSPEYTQTFQVALKRVGSAQWIIAPEGDLTSGVRDHNRRGNIGQQNQITLYDLPAGEYMWYVQAIDGDQRGSMWTQQGFSYVKNAQLEGNLALQVSNNEAYRGSNSSTWYKNLQATITANGEHYANVKAVIFAYKQDLTFNFNAGCYNWHFAGMQLADIYICQKPSLAVGEQWQITGGGRYVKPNPQHDLLWMKTFSSQVETDYNDNQFQESQTIQ